MKSRANKYPLNKDLYPARDMSYENQMKKLQHTLKKNKTTLNNLNNLILT